jgi:hypothetical protein
MSRSVLVVVLTACAGAVAGTAPAAPVPIPTDEQDRLLARGKKFAERGEVDLFVAATAVWKLKADDLRIWGPAAILGRKLIERAEMTGDRKPQDTPSTYKDFAAFVDHWKPGFKRLDETYFRPDPAKADPPVAFYREAIQAPGVVDATGICNCLILSRDSVQAGRGIQHSVVFANGNVVARTIMQSTVIVCDGDVDVAEGRIGRSVIVARGNITAKSAGTIALMAGGKVEFENKKTLKGYHLIVEGKPNTLSVTFFELAGIGLDVKAADQTVTVTKVTAGSACEKAGLKIGDTILDVGGKKPTDAESLRRLLRDALAIGDATVKIQRGDKTETVKVVLPE